MINGTAGGTDDEIMPNTLKAFFIAQPNTI